MSNGVPFVHIAYLLAAKYKNTIKYELSKGEFSQANELLEVLP
jgi:hypothetical protein